MAEGLSKKQIKELRKLEKLQSRNLEQKNSSVKWVAITIISALFLVLFVGVVLVAKNKNKPTTSTGSAQFADNGHSRMINTKGEEATNSADPSAKSITLVEYGDIQCPACKVSYPVVNELLGAYPDRLKFTFKHFPLVSIHPNAMASAIAAEAAGRQNKFFEFVDKAYELQESWAGLQDPQPKFEEIAKQVGLNVDQFKKDQKDPAVEQAVSDQRDEGIKNGVTGTPTFFLNGERIENPTDANGFKKLIDPLLKTSSSPQTQQASPTSAPDTLPLQ